MRLEPLQRVRIGTRLIVSSVLLFIIYGVTVAVMLLRLHELSDAFEHLGRDRLVLLRLAADIELNASNATRKLLVLISAERDQRIQAYRALDGANREIDRAMSDIERRLPQPLANPQFRELSGSLQSFRRAYAANVDLIEADELTAAREMMSRETEVGLGMLTRATEGLLRSEQQEASNAAEHLRTQIHSDTWWLIGLCALGMAVGTALAVAVRRSITGPLEQTEQAALRMARGELLARAPTQGHDEVARVAGALNALAQAVSEREQRLLRLANTDAMTGLAQRGRFLVESRMAMGMVDTELYAVLCMDLDRLKTINALLGFDTGDEAIREAGRRMQAELGDTQPLARLGGGTFVCAYRAASAADAQQRAQALRAAVEQPMRSMGQSLDLSISAGLALGPDHGMDAETLLRHAEQALFEAKRLKNGLQHFDPRTELARQQDLTLASQLQAALHRGELRAFLQPKLRIADGSLAGAECLIRWQHSQHGLVPPADFIPFAERTGRIRALTRWMIDEALRVMSLPQQQGLKLAVNISTHDLHDRELLEHLRTALVRSGVDPQRLTLEITESGLMEGGDEPVALLHALRALGLRLSIDDFGTGHSALAYLQRLPVDELKIDRSFVADVDQDGRRRALLAGIVQLGQGLGLQITAEGIEREAELQVLRELGCDLAQGYLLGKPMDVERFADWSATRASAGEART